MTTNIPVGASALLERDSELEALGAALDAARTGAGRLAVVEGHAGMGKSQLLSAARGLAKATGVRVLEATGSDLERDFAFGVALQLLEPAVTGATPAQRERLLSGAAALCEQLFEKPGTESGRARGRGRLPIPHGLYWLVSNLAEGGPLLIAVDDAHWADAPSLRFLIYLAQRLGALPVAMVVARRSEEPGEEGLLARLAGHPSAARVELGPLSAEAVERLVRATFDRGVDPGFPAACTEVTRGNPLLVNHMLATLEAEGTAPTRTASAAYASWGRRRCLARCCCVFPRSSWGRPRWPGRSRCWATGRRCDGRRSPMSRAAR